MKLITRYIDLETKTDADSLRYMQVKKEKSEELTDG